MFKITKIFINAYKKHNLNGLIYEEVKMYFDKLSLTDGVATKDKTT